MTINTSYYNLPRVLIINIYPFSDERKRENQSEAHKQHTTPPILLQSFHHSQSITVEAFLISDSSSLYISDIMRRPQVSFSLLLTYYYFYSIIEERYTN